MGIFPLYSLALKLGLLALSVLLVLGDSLPFTGRLSTKFPLGPMLFAQLPKYMNATLGHSNALWSLGIVAVPRSSGAKENSVEDDEGSADSSSKGGEVISEDELWEAKQLIKVDEMDSALEKTLDLAEKSKEEIVKANWRLVHDSDNFQLYKRRDEPATPGGHSPVVYLMIGEFVDVSPLTFLHSQIDREVCHEYILI